MWDAPQPTQPALLTGPRPIGGALPGNAVQALGALRRRAALAGSDIFRDHGEAIRRITFGLSYGQPARPAERPERKFLRVVTWNIERGKQVGAICAYLRDHPVLSRCDALLLNEADVGMARSGNLDVAESVAQALGFEWVFGNSYLCLSPGNARDGGPAGENALGLHGNAILSRWPILRAENFSLAVTKDKFHSSEKRLGHKKAIWAEIETPLGRLPLCSVHLDSGASSEQRAAQLDDALSKLEAAGVAERSLVGGDFNTTTYDLKSIPRLLWNIFSKLLRGGFPHAIHHYVHPDELYEKPVFDALQARGVSYKGFNAPAIGTTRYEVGTFDSESKVRDYLPEIAVKILRWKLKPWNGVAPLKIDWFAARGLRPLESGERTDSDGRTSLAPSPIERPRWQGRLLSDHDPIVVDIAF